MLKRLLKSIKYDASELYTGVVLVIFIPLVVSFMTSLSWGFLLSFVVQALIGILYIRNSK